MSRAEFLAVDKVSECAFNPTKQNGGVIIHEGFWLIKKEYKDGGLLDRIESSLPDCSAILPPTNVAAASSCPFRNGEQSTLFTSTFIRPGGAFRLASKTVSGSLGAERKNSANSVRAVYRILLCERLSPTKWVTPPGSGAPLVSGSNTYTRTHIHPYGDLYTSICSDIIGRRAAIKRISRPSNRWLSSSSLPPPALLLVIDRLLDHSIWPTAVRRRVSWSRTGTAAWWKARGSGKQAINMNSNQYSSYADGQ